MGHWWRIADRPRYWIFLPKGICPSIRWIYSRRIRCGLDGDFYNLKRKAEIEPLSRGACCFHNCGYKNVTAMKWMGFARSAHVPRETLTYDVV